MKNLIILTSLFLINSSFHKSKDFNESEILAPKRVQVTVVVRSIQCLSVNDGSEGSKDGEEIYGYIKIEPGLYCRDLTNYDIEKHQPQNVLGYFGTQWSTSRNKYKQMKKGDVININKTVQFDIPLPIPCGISREQFAVTIISNLDEYDSGRYDDDDLLQSNCEAKECSTRWPQMINVVDKPFKEEMEHTHSSGGTKVVVKFSLTCTPVYN